MASPDFTEDYTCPDCQRGGAPMSDEASCEEFDRGWHVTCPDCGFSVQGRDKAMVFRAIVVLASWNGTVSKMMEGSRQ